MAQPISQPIRMKFGVFLAPFHRVDENPTLALERDAELLEWLDTLGYDEAWIGEHHSAGWETIASPEVFIASVAQRTQHLRLGTGVISLPYHHPVMVAGRMTLLDHLTRGRVMLGVGPGALVSDAYMLGIDPEKQRERMEESLGIILRLFEENDPISYKSDWFELREASLQLKSYQRPHLPVVVASASSPAGVKAAGKYGAGVLSISVPSSVVRTTNLKELWAIAEQEADRHGKTMRREEWRLVMPCHVAESRREAIEQVRLGGTRYITEYVSGTLGQPLPDVPVDQIVDHMIEKDLWLIGSPDDCVEGLRRLEEASGGFGGFMVQTIDWAPREQVLHSYELIARYVAPQFQGALTGIRASNQWTTDNKELFQAGRLAALKRADADYFARSK